MGDDNKGRNKWEKLQMGASRADFGADEAHRSMPRRNRLTGVEASSPFNFQSLPGFTLPEGEDVRQALEAHFVEKGLSADEIKTLMQDFDNGQAGKPDAEKEEPEIYNM